MATLKQKKAIDLIAQGNSVSKAMRQVGYSKNTAKNPKVLTDSIAFRETMENLGITDDLLAQRLKEGLEAKETVYIKDEGLIQTDIPDHNTRHKFIETNLRLKGHAKESAPSVVVVPIYGGRDTINV